MNKKYCPIKFPDPSREDANAFFCEEKECAWWFIEEGECAIKSLAHYLNHIWANSMKKKEKKHE